VIRRKTAGLTVRLDHVIFGAPMGYMTCSACGRPIAIDLPFTAELVSCCGVPICKDSWEEDRRCSDASHVPPDRPPT
jgi:hypothetical protein